MTAYTALCHRGVADTGKLLRAVVINMLGTFAATNAAVQEEAKTRFRLLNESETKQTDALASE